MIQIADSVRDILKSANLKEFKHRESFNSDQLNSLHDRYAVNSGDMIYGVIDTSYNESSNDGVLFTDKGIYWRNDSTVDGRVIDKGSLAYEDIKLSNISYEEKTATTWITVQYTQLRENKFTVIIKLLVDDSNELQSLFEKLERSIKNVPDQEPIPFIEISNDVQYIDAFTGCDDEKEASTYRSLFYKWRESTQFQFSWSTIAAVLGPLFYFHRKLNKEGGIILGVSLVSVLIHPVLLLLTLLISGASFNYLYFKRYRSLKEKAIEECGETDEAVDYIRKKAGTSKFTSFALIAAFLVYGLVAAQALGIINFSSANKISLAQNYRLAEFPDLPIAAILSKYYHDIKWRIASDDPNVVIFQGKTSGRYFGEGYGSAQALMFKVTSRGVELTNYLRRITNASALNRWTNYNINSFIRSIISLERNNN